jgi:hypothetical protein
MRAPNSVMTNRDLYLFIAELCQHHAEHDQPLEAYLRALWQLGHAERERPHLPLTRFAALLAEAFEITPPPFEPAWAREAPCAPDDDYARWEQIIRHQIIDLHEMAAAGMLADAQRWFGIDAPRGARWYNFTPTAFLECGVAGTFDGWEPGDSTSRDFVPGPVAVVDARGQLVTVDPRDLAPATFAIEPLSWATFADFLVAGQQYE